MVMRVSTLVRFVFERSIRVMFVSSLVTPRMRFPVSLIAFFDSDLETEMAAWTSAVHWNWSPSSVTCERAKQLQYK